MNDTTGRRRFVANVWIALGLLAGLTVLEAAAGLAAGSQATSSNLVATMIGTTAIGWYFAMFFVVPCLLVLEFVARRTRRARRLAIVLGPLVLAAVLIGTQPRSNLLADEVLGFVAPAIVAAEYGLLVRLPPRSPSEHVTFGRAD